MSDWEAFEAATTVAVDTETSGLFPDDGARVACVAVAWRGGSIALPFDQGVLDKNGIKQLAIGERTVDWNLNHEHWERFIYALTKKQLVFHNALFDLIMLWTGTRHWSGIDLSSQLAWDTMLAHRVLRPTSSAGLDAAAQELGVGEKTGLEPVLAWLKENKLPKNRYDLAPWELIEPYVRADAETTRRLYEAQLEEVKDKGGLLEIQRECDLAVTLMRMEKRGLGYDARRSLKAAKELEEKAATIEATLPFPCTPFGARDYFIERGLTPDRVTEKGAPSIDAEQIRDWEIAGVPYAKEYREASRAKRAASMWYRGFVEKLGDDGRLRCRFKQSHVVSGRLSVERVNLQALPKADKIEDGMPPVRELLKTSKGTQLWSLDMSQAELRVAARYSGCERMLELLAEGMDFHAKTTEDVMGVAPDHPEWKLKRDIGKKLTFGSIYGIGGEHFQALLAKETGIHITSDESYRLVNGWRNTYPEIMQAYNLALRKLRECGYVRILPGTELETRSYFQGHELEHSAWNRVVQGSVAAFVRLWLVEIEHEHPDVLVGSVHDSVLLELPSKTAKKTAKEIAAKASERASVLFGVQMPVDEDRWK